MKIIFNKEFIDEENLSIQYTDRVYFSGEFVNGYGWFFNNKVLFWEDIYFQLMASMRKMRINIPISFTPEIFEDKILSLSKELHITQGRFKITVFKTASFIIEFLPYKDFFSISKNDLDVYKEVNIYPTLLSSIHIFSPVNITAYQYAEENDFQDVILLNHEKRVARSINGNIFFIKDNVITTNSTSEGAFISVLKKNFSSFLKEKTDYSYKEEKISPFELQSAEEVFILSDEKGLIPITKIRKKEFNTEIIRFLSKKFIGFALQNQD